MVIKPKESKRYRIILGPEFVKEAAGDGVSITRTFEESTIYVDGVDTFIQSGADFDYFCVRGDDGSTNFTVPAFKVRYCNRVPKRGVAKVFTVAGAITRGGS